MKHPTRTFIVITRLMDNEVVATYINDIDAAMPYMVTVSGLNSIVGVDEDQIPKNVGETTRIVKDHDVQRSRDILREWPKPVN